MTRNGERPQRQDSEGVAEGTFCSLWGGLRKTSLGLQVL